MFVLILHQMFSCQIASETGVMTLRNQISRYDFGKSLNQVTAKDFEQSASNPDHATNNSVQHIVKSITTSCKSLGHTTEASQDARKHQFAIMDYFGLNGLFLTITPDDKCSF
jgi:hypothetical protein